MKVLSVSSQVAWGPVGNSATVPALESLGHMVMEVPTIVLSHHPGHGKPAGFRVPASDLAAMLSSLKARGALAALDGIFTGYFATADQVGAMAAFIRSLKAEQAALRYFCDPVAGDDPGGLYVPLDVAEAIHAELIPLADAIAPNRFELFWLSGEKVDTPREAIRAARGLGIRETLATSIPEGGGLATVLILAEEAFTVVSEKRANVPHGTGDLLSGLYFGHRLAGAAPEAALTAAMERLAIAIAASTGSAALDLRKGLA